MVSSSIGHCRWCNEPVFGAAADLLVPEHPCCAWWIGEQGHRRCVACLESRRLAREHHRRQHVGAGKAKDLSCVFCATAERGAA